MEFDQANPEKDNEEKTPELKEEQVAVIQKLELTIEQLRTKIAELEKHSALLDQERTLKDHGSAIDLDKGRCVFDTQIPTAKQKPNRW
ncbi:hypothetical protein chiPu_0001090 [Chiloscyllium punctatum]|uniref:Uncharacterized protein n=1 Tax=Chiloscyllium punctatum TaxID=137246 RepID=A0A401RX42_CHIPU|nr:hypothetical protein [Chiloscyllium punctatum]